MTNQKTTNGACLHPWYSVDISYNGFAKVGCCPYKGRPLRLRNPAAPDISEIWRSDWFQILRKGFSAGQEVPAGCRGCEQYLHKDQIHVPRDLNKQQHTNLESCLKSAGNGETDVKHAPVRYSLCFTSKCNLKCIMCSQHDSRESAGNELSAQGLLAQKDLLARASSILVSGGEPLLSTECTRFIEALCTDPLLRNVGLEIVTNGLLLDRVIPFLENKNSLSVHISLDGTGETYEKVRVGGSWEKVSSQIEKILEVKKQSGHDWKIATSCILMASTLPGLAEYLSWCIDRGIGVVLQELMATGETQQENLVGNPTLLRDIPGWERYLENSRQILESAGETNLAERLRTYQVSLHTAINNGTGGPVIVSYKNFRRGTAGKGKRIIIWGTGSNYRDCWSGWLADKRDEIDFLGFVDNDPERWHTKVDGYPVHSPSELEGGVKPDFIIVASQIVWREEIIRQCLDMGWDDVQFV